MNIEIDGVKMLMRCLDDDGTLTFYNVMIGSEIILTKEKV